MRNQINGNFQSPPKESFHYIGEPPLQKTLATFYALVLRRKLQRAVLIMFIFLFFAIIVLFTKNFANASPLMFSARYALTI